METPDLETALRLALINIVSNRLEEGIVVADDLFEWLDGTMMNAAMSALDGPDAMVLTVSLRLLCCFRNFFRP